MKYKYHNIITFLQMGADLLMVMLSLQISFWIWELSPFRRQTQIILPSTGQFVVIGLFFILLFYTQGAYKRKASILDFNARKKLISAMLIGSGLIIIYSFFTQTIMLGRLQILYFLIALLFLIGIERYLFDQFHTYLLHKGVGARRVLIFGAGETGRRLAVALQRYPKLGYYPIGFLDDYIKINKKKIGNPLQILGTSMELEVIMQRYNAEEIIIAIPSAPENRMQEVIKRCLSAGISYRYVPNLYDTAIQRIRTEVIDGIPVFGRVRLNFTPVNAFIKRICDYLFSAIAVIISVPLVLLISIAIKVDSPGPVIFKQKRIGRHGKPFILWKFRTMFKDVDPYETHPLDRNDARITRFGRWLRRSSLDELPQFWNVFRGEMSIVGPRPEMPFIVEIYNDLHRERLNVRPGITGLWQISADRALPIHENIDHDLFYIQNQSLLMDMLIIGKTFWVALSGLGN